MADSGHIKVDPELTRSEIAKIAEAVRSVAVEGPVPTATGTSPIDLALAKVARTQAAQAKMWAEKLQERATDDLVKSEKALQMLEETERQNAAALNRLAAEVGAGEAGAGGYGARGDYVNPQGNDGPDAVSV
ncbi:hypothetical protein LV457_04130 [Mycobacterium sp. MYCO198283]|uniref:hypothetical protein n=1 Tax=Mycobacterium sp. MYCO198283 TaxID=2883505 RepID=UPI001E4651D9|nr:hypothetical protein [Mycobacterium sp. MYCO198283]MCG5431479.1 hypothetical protein [Mycobacterium sp. MYCO198283]